MVRIEISYSGEKHCELTHEPSSRRISTDAPKDNKGRGEAFSPTDMVAGALGSCILTTMAIIGESENLDLTGCRASVDKEMSPPPRKIAQLRVQLHLPKSWTDDQRARMEGIAQSCPVTRSLNTSVEIPMVFIYDV